VAGGDLVVPGWVEAVQAAAGGPVTETVVQGDLGDIVKVLRLARRDGGLTQVALAAHLGVGGSSVASWETGDGIPSVPHLIGWARLVRLRPVILDADRRPMDCVLLRVPGEDRETYEARRLAVVLREHRKARPGYTQADVAVRAHVHRGSVRRWERADRPMPTEGLLRWARALGCTVTLLPQDRDFSSEHDDHGHER
jgi:transcriptional regulator with XRE-family HTH domain